MTEPRTQASCANPDDPGILQPEEALARILEAVPRVEGTQWLGIRAALGRTLAADLRSPVQVPAHANSAMDGYALRHADLEPDRPSELAVIGTAWAGRPFQGRLGPSECVRIMTGAVIPRGADTVIMQEQVEALEAGVRIAPGARPGSNIRAAGEDLALGEVTVPAGTRIGPAELGLLASLGSAEVAVSRPLRVAFFSTGDELRGVGQALGEGEIYDSNRYTLYGMLARLGVSAVDMGVVRDDPRTMERAFKQAGETADVVITTGGVSVGEADYVRDCLEALGQVGFWKIAIKPGRPLAFGRLGDAVFFGLPGNPVAVMVTFYQFVQPALRHMLGQARVRPHRYRVACGERIAKRPGRTEYLRARLETGPAGETVARRAGAQGSGVLSSMSRADCLIVLPSNCAGVEPGEPVAIEPFEGLT